MHKVKTVLAVVAIVYAVLFVFFNARNNTNVWLFFGAEVQAVSVLLVMVVSAGLGLVVWWTRDGLLRLVRGVGGKSGPSGK